jgi:hypothetical protein
MIRDWKIPAAAILFATLAHGSAVAQRADLEALRIAPTARDVERGKALLERMGTRGDVVAEKGAAPLPTIVLTGYWPPTNEMIRRFSTDPVKNPQGWIGANWENRGYDVHAFFPEFTPPTCTSCGKGSGQLEVDYQDSSNDFWPIVDGLDPIAVITFSRGKNNMTWEVEMNQYNRATWVNDYVAPLQPTPAPPDASVPAGFLRLSKLPVQDIVNAVAAANLGLSPFICFSQDGGGFLSEFMAYHGVWYQSLHDSPAMADWCVTAGHVHVGSQINWATATLAAEVTLRTVIQHVDQERAATVCQLDLGNGGPGNARLAMCGDAFASGNAADILLSDAKPSTPTVWFLGLTANPTPINPFATFVPLPIALTFTLPTDASGSVFLNDVPGGGGPVSVYMQCAFADGTLPGGVGLSNALKIDLLP